ncbi:MAG: CoA transferase [Saccharopolyspora sp.]|uniref:CaiB/BaiF CoA transferase family protein n=1 Tax=Saccharopolyspora sp. TaxID=33915 RepID=UPI0025DD1A65|nr:CaiB/BaiF CoA-transferase family protein [Saccharopolyspora sp.]MBQ6640537.1 CoA transferase [Saccharopolyspora sp.]
MMRPLDGITVVSIEQAVAAPFATRQLADLGARVFMIERPGDGDFARRYDESVDGQASYFVWLNRSKESLALDLKDQRGRAVLDELLAEADVFVQNLAPGAAARMGLDAESLDNGKLIVCDVSGFGSSGSWSQRKAYDLLVQCQTGLVSLTGGEEPAKVGVSIADISAGMYAYSGILSALYLRATTGEARSVEVSLFDSLAEWVSQPAHFTRHTGTQPQRAGASHPTIAPYGPFTTADGKQVLLAVQNDREWAALCGRFLGDTGLTGDERFATNSARVRHRDELDGIIADRFACLDSEEAGKLLDEIGIANAGLNSVAEFLQHPALTERGRWRDIGIPGSVVPALLPPAILSGVDPRMDPVPDVGDHSGTILAELGRNQEEIGELRAQGVI